MDPELWPLVPGQGGGRGLATVANTSTTTTMEGAAGSPGGSPDAGTFSSSPPRIGAGETSA